MSRAPEVLVREPHHHVVGEEVALAVLDVRRVAHGEVGDGVDEQLEGDRRPAGGLRHLRDDGREVAPGRVAAHGDAGGVDVQLGGMVDHPHDRVERIVDRCREGVLGRQAVVDRHHGHPGLVGEGAALAVGGLEVADDEAAAVEPHEHRKGLVGRGAERAVHPDAEVAARARDQRGRWPRPPPRRAWRQAPRTRCGSRRGSARSAAAPAGSRRGRGTAGLPASPAWIASELLPERPLVPTVRTGASSHTTPRLAGELPRPRWEARPSTVMPPARLAPMGAEVPLVYAFDHKHRAPADGASRICSAARARTWRR